MNLYEYKGKPFALLLCGETEYSEDDWAVFSGTAYIRNDKLYLERYGDQPDIEIMAEWYERIQETNESVKDILQGADYFITLSVGQMPEDADDSYIPLGLKWPKDDKGK